MMMMMMRREAHLVLFVNRQNGQKPAEHLVQLIGVCVHNSKLVQNLQCPRLEKPLLAQAVVREQVSHGAHGLGRGQLRHCVIHLNRCRCQRESVKNPKKRKVSANLCLFGPKKGPIFSWGAFFSPAYALGRLALTSGTPEGSLGGAPAVMFAFLDALRRSFDASLASLTRSSSMLMVAPPLSPW